MKVYLEAARLAIYRIAASKDSGVALNPLTAAVSKMYLGDRGFEMSSEAVDLFGGYGYIHEYPVEGILRDTKLGQVGGGRRYAPGSGSGDANRPNCSMRHR